MNSLFGCSESEHVGCQQQWCVVKKGKRINSQSYNAITYVCPYKSAHFAALLAVYCLSF